MTEKDVPEQYQDYKDVFSKEKAKRFPLAREDDHQIKFTENVLKYFKVDVYSLTIDQMTFLRKWLDEELDKGFIRPSKLPYPWPTFLIEKKNSELSCSSELQNLERTHSTRQTPSPPHHKPD
jgi:hypothetical protein